MRNKLIRKVVTLTLAAVMVVSSGAAVFGASYIGKDAAVSKALKNAGTTRSAVWELECERDSDDGITVYEVEFIKGSTEYSYTINAKTGNIREKSVEYRYVPSSKARIGKSAAKNKVFSFSGINFQVLYAIMTMMMARKYTKLNSEKAITGTNTMLMPDRAKS